jgi:hypothetical protein
MSSWEIKCVSLPMRPSVEGPLRVDILSTSRGENRDRIRKEKQEKMKRKKKRESRCVKVETDRRVGTK